MLWTERSSRTLLKKNYDDDGDDDHNDDDDDNGDDDDDGNGDNEDDDDDESWREGHKATSVVYETFTTDADAQSCKMSWSMWKIGEKNWKSGQFNEDEDDHHTF